MIALGAALLGALVMAGLCVLAEWSHHDDERKRRVEAARRRYMRSSR